MKTPHEQCAEEIGNGFTEYVRHDKDFTDEDIVKILSKHFPQPPTSTPSLDEVIDKHRGAYGLLDTHEAKAAILEYNASLVAEVERLENDRTKYFVILSGLMQRTSKEKFPADCVEHVAVTIDLALQERDQLRTQLATAEAKVDDEWLDSIAQHWKKMFGENYEILDGESREEGLNNNISKLFERLSTAEQTGYERGVREAAEVPKSCIAKYGKCTCERCDQNLFIHNIILNLLNKKD